MTLSVIVAATDRPATLEQSLAGIRAAQEPGDELLVVDSPAHLGPAAARNAGVAEVLGDVLVFVDSDVVPHPDAFRRIRERLHDEPELDGVFGSYDSYPQHGGVISTFRNLLPHHVHQASAGPSGSFWAGLGAVRREAFVAVGGFDAERYPGPHVEDIDLGMRLAEAGRRIMLDPAIQGTHLKQWSLTDTVRTDLFYRGAPWVALLLHHRRVPRELNLAHRHRVTAAASVVALGGIAARRPLAAVGAVGVQAVLNRDLYGLMRRRLGLRAMVASVGLHSLHHLTGVASIPVGAFGYARERRGRERLASERRRSRRVRRARRDSPDRPGAEAAPAAT
jgi:GT2 family glycosyltransferase